MKKYIKLRLMIYILLILIISIQFFSSIHPTLIMDEEFSMGIIQHSYINIIGIDSLDVHPPLYYLLLKLFIQITTFWTKSMLIKVLVARLFSFSAFIGFIIFLLKSFKEMGINVNKKVQILLYLFIPSILLYSTTIRMYALSALFISGEFYYIINFNQKCSKKYLILVILFASLASYTHYFAAVSGGMLILICFLMYLMKGKVYKCTWYLISGLSFAIAYIPLIPFVVAQVKYESSHNNKANLQLFHQLYASFAGVGYSVGLVRMSLITLIIILFTCLIIWSFCHLNYKFNKYLFILLADFFSVMAIASISNIINGTPFNSRYMYSIFSILSFFIAFIFTQVVYTHYNNLIKYIMIILSLVLLALSCHYEYRNIIMFDIPSIQLVHNYYDWYHIRSNHIYVNTANLNNAKYNALYVSQSAIYLRSLHKIILINPKTSNPNSIRKNLFGHNNKKLFKLLFNNLYFK